MSPKPIKPKKTRAEIRAARRERGEQQRALRDLPPEERKAIRKEQSRRRREGVE